MCGGDSNVCIFAHVTRVCCLFVRLLAFLMIFSFLDWIAGFISAWTILIEQKSRRSELSLYVLPRTIDSLIMTMQDRKVSRAAWSRNGRCVGLRCFHGQVGSTE